MAEHADAGGHHVLHRAAALAVDEALGALVDDRARPTARSSPGSTSAIRREKTRPSSSELEASRLAPWTPEQATSPVA